MDEYEAEKTKFIQKLYLVNNWRYNDIFNFFEDVFDYLRLKKLLNIETFSDEESNALNECLNKLILIFSNDFNGFLSHLTVENCYKILKIRSVLEFIKTDFCDFTNELSKQTLTRLTEYDSDLWDKVDDTSSNDRILYSSDRGEIPDITGIPASHYWWTEFHRKGEENPNNFNFENYVENVYPNYKSV